MSAAPAGQERLRAAELADAEALLERLAREEGLDEVVELRSEVGPAADRILRVCEEEDASLVVVGSRGRGDLRAAVLGSVSHAVAGRAPCPAVTVSPEAVARVLAAT